MMSSEKVKTMSDETPRDSLTHFGDEMMGGGGARAVAAWLEMCDPDTQYGPEDEEAPYALRSAVGEDIGTLAAGDGLTTTDAEIERYRDYIDLRRVYGGEWPVPALADYLNIVKEMSGGVEEDSAQAIWRAAIEKYECEREKKRLVALSKDRRLHDPKGEPLDEVCL